jgi:hypothetical protein
MNRHPHLLLVPIKEPAIECGEALSNSFRPLMAVYWLSIGAVGSELMCRLSVTV